MNWPGYILQQSDEVSANHDTVRELSSNRESSTVPQLPFLLHILSGARKTQMAAKECDIHVHVQ